MKFIAEYDALTIQLEGMEIVASLRRKIVIPRDKITNLTWQPQYVYEGRRVIRLGGVALPRTIFAGNFWGSVGWYFLYVHNPKGARWLRGAAFSADNVLDIATNDYVYKRVILTCQPDIGASLLNWFKNV